MPKTVDKKVICPFCKQEFELDIHALETERQLNLSKNGIITLNRGDTFTLPIYINLGSALHPEYYTLKSAEDYREQYPEEAEFITDEDRDYIYFALLEPQQKWEHALVKKVFPGTRDDFRITEDGTILIHFFSEDTGWLLPGNYYYEIKLQRFKGDVDHFEHVDTIVPRTKFVIVE